MSLPNGQPLWHPPSLNHANSNKSLHHPDDAPARTQTPIDNSNTLMPEAQLDVEEESRRALFADLYRKTEDKIALLFSEDGSINHDAIRSLRRTPPPTSSLIPLATDHEPIQEPPLKKAKRTIDEDDYDDDEDEDDESTPSAPKPLTVNAAANTLLSPSKSGSSPVHSVTSPDKQHDKSKESDSSQSQRQDGRRCHQETGRGQGGHRGGCSAQFPYNLSHSRQ